MAKAVSTFKIHEIMTASPIAVIFNDKVRDIMQLFIDKGISGAAVIEPATGKVLSVVTESDLMKIAALHNLNEPLATFKTKLPQTAELIVVHPDDAFAEVFKQLITKPVRRVLVIDRDMHLVGMVARRDILKAFLNSHSETK